MKQGYQVGPVVSNILGLAEFALHLGDSVLDALHDFGQFGLITGGMGWDCFGKSFIDPTVFFKTLFTVLALTSMPFLLR